MPRDPKIPAIVAVWRYMRDSAVDGVWRGLQREITTALSYSQETVSTAILDMHSDGTIEYLERGLFSAPSSVRVGSVEPVVMSRGPKTTDERKDQVRQMHREGVPIGEMPGRLGISKGALLGIRRRLGLADPRNAPVLRRSDGSYAVQRQAGGGPSVAPYARIAAQPQPFPPKDPGGRGGSSIHVGSINWRALPPAPARECGVCAWPLTCEEPAVGHWCAGHASLLGPRVRQMAAE